MYLSFIYSIYQLPKAGNNLSLVNVAAALVVTPQGARKTIPQQTAEKSLQMNGAFQLNYTAPLFTDAQQT